MSEPESARPFFEEPWFRGTAAVLGVVAVVFTLVGPPKLWEVIADLFSDELPPDNTQYVLDASEAMGVPFGAEGSKLTAAARTIAEAVAPHETAGLALRRFGGTCEERGELLVDFGDGQADEVGEAAAEQNAAGNSNLANAVIAAIDDFSDGDRFPSDRDIKKRIVVVTGSADECFRDDASEQIRRRITQTGIELDFTFVGVAVPEEERDRLREVAGDLESPVVFADTDEELGLVVDFLELEPAISEAGEVADIYNSVKDELSGFVEAANADQFGAAERALARTEDALAGTEPPFKRLGERTSRADVVTLHALLGDARVLQGELLDIGQTLVDAGRALEGNGSEGEYRNAAAEWRGVVRLLDDKVAEIQRAIDELTAKLPPLEG